MPQIVLERLEALCLEMNRAQRNLLRAIRRCDLAQAHVKENFSDFALWVSHELGIEVPDARTLVAVATSIERLPLIEQAFEAGAISMDQLIELVRLATPELEKYLLHWAKQVPVETLQGASPHIASA